MPPRLQAETLWEVNKRWLFRVRFLLGTDPEFIASVCMALEPIVFTPGDMIYGNEELFVVYRGMAMYGGRVLTSGHVWGEDMLLECEALRVSSSAKALSYLETNRVGRERVFQISRSFPRSYKALRKFAGFLALRRQMLMMAKIEKAVRAANGMPHRRSEAMALFFEGADVRQLPVIAKLKELEANGLTREIRHHIATTMKDAPEPLANFFAASVTSATKGAGLQKLGARVALMNQSFTRGLSTPAFKKKPRDSSAGARPTAGGSVKAVGSSVLGGCATRVGGAGGASSSSSNSSSSADAQRHIATPDSRDTDSDPERVGSGGSVTGGGGQGGGGGGELVEGQRSHRDHHGGDKDSPPRQLSRSRLSPEKGDGATAAAAAAGAVQKLKKANAANSVVASVAELRAEMRAFMIEVREENRSLREALTKRLDGGTGEQRVDGATLLDA